MKSINELSYHEMTTISGGRYSRIEAGAFYGAGIGLAGAIGSELGELYRNRNRTWGERLQQVAMQVITGGLAGAAAIFMVSDRILDIP